MFAKFSQTFTLFFLSEGPDSTKLNHLLHKKGSGDPKNKLLGYSSGPSIPASCPKQWLGRGTQEKAARALNPQRAAPWHALYSLLSTHRPWKVLLD